MRLRPCIDCSHKKVTIYATRCRRGGGGSTTADGLASGRPSFGETDGLVHAARERLDGNLRLWWPNCRCSYTGPSRWPHLYRGAWEGWISTAERAQGAGSRMGHQEAIARRGVKSTSEKIIRCSPFPHLCRVADAGEGTQIHAPTAGVGNWPRDEIAERWEVRVRLGAMGI